MKAKMKKDARMKMLKKLKDEMMGDKHSGMEDMMKGMQKVTVASDSKEGLMKGLEKAEEIMEKKSEYADGGYKRGYKEGKDGMEEKKPKYLSHRRENKELMYDQYKDGGTKETLAEKIMRKRKKR